MGHHTVGVATREEAIKQIDKSHFDVAFLDLKLDGESGLDGLPVLLKNDPRLDVVVFTAFASIETAVEAMRRGAVDYVPKPFTPEQIRHVLERILRARKLEGCLIELEYRISFCLATNHDRRPSWRSQRQPPRLQAETRAVQGPAPNHVRPPE
jgi:two-component system, NtrC family, response regulator AlgB